MKIALVIALVTYLVAVYADSTITPRQFVKESKISSPSGSFEKEGSELQSNKKTFNTLIKNKRTTYVTINSSIVEVVVPITINIEIQNVVLSNDTIELDILTTNDTMVTSITTIVTTSSTSTSTTMEIDIVTGPTSTLEQTVISKTTAAPVEKIKLKVILSSSDISFGNIDTSNITTIQAVAAACSKIKEIVTTSQTIKGSTALSIELISNNGCESSSTPSTPSYTESTFCTTNPVSLSSTMAIESFTSSTELPITGSERFETDTSTKGIATTKLKTVKPTACTSYTTHSNTDQSLPNPTSSERVETDTTANGTTTPKLTTVKPITSTSDKTHSNTHQSSPNPTSSERIETDTTADGTTTPKLTTVKSITSTSARTYSNTTSSERSATTSSGLTTLFWTTTVSSSPSPSFNVCDKEYSCANCTTVRVCAPSPGGRGLSEVVQFSCPDQTPWCDSDSGTCSEVRSPECDLPVVGNFTCMRNGHFPDPNSCADYYLCDNGVPLEFTCLYPLPYYSPLSQSCGNISSDCVDYLSLCKGKSGVKVPIPHVNNLFVYCVEGAVEVVDKCIGAYQFDIEQQGCVPRCPYAGLFPSDNDCADYYKCSPSDMRDHYELTNLTCPQGTGFSESAYDCIDRSLVFNCNVTYIS